MVWDLGSRMHRSSGTQAGWLVKCRGALASLSVITQEKGARAHLRVSAARRVHLGAPGGPLAHWVPEREEAITHSLGHQRRAERCAPGSRV